MKFSFQPRSGEIRYVSAYTRSQMPDSYKLLENIEKGGETSLAITKGVTYRLKFIKILIIVSEKVQRNFSSMIVYLPCSAYSNN